MEGGDKSNANTTGIGVDSIVVGVTQFNGDINHWWLAVLGIVVRVRGDERGKMVHITATSIVFGVEMKSDAPNAGYVKLFSFRSNINKFLGNAGQL